MKKIISVLLIMMICICGACPVFADVTAEQPIASDPKVTIVNPTEDGTINSANLLISVKIAKQANITVDVQKRITKTTTAAAVDGTDKVNTVTTTEYESIIPQESFASTSNLSFYTKKIENIEVGTYKVIVNTVDSEGTVLYSSERTVKVEVAEEKTAVFEETKTGTFTFLQNLLKTIFGN